VHLDVKINRQCKNTKEELLKTSAAMWFNKMCRINRLASKCTRVKETTNNFLTGFNESAIINITALFL